MQEWHRVINLGIFLSTICSSNIFVHSTILAAYHTTATTLQLIAWNIIIPTIHFRLKYSLYLTKVILLNSSFHLVCLISSPSSTLSIYKHPHHHHSLLKSCSFSPGMTILSDLTSFLLFTTRTVHFSIPSSILCLHWLLWQTVPIYQPVFRLFHTALDHSWTEDDLLSVVLTFLNTSVSRIMQCQYNQ